MIDLKDFRASLRNRNHAFSDTLAFIASNYDYQPSRFVNGTLENAAGENEGSCKTLGLALLEGFTARKRLCSRSANTTRRCWPTRTAATIATSAR